MWKKGCMLEDEVSRDDFDASVFIDRAFTRSSGECKDNVLNVEHLKSTFELLINNLQSLRCQINNRAGILQQKCILSERTFKGDLKNIIQHIETIDKQFSDLDKRIRQVSEKVYIGDQLDRKCIPRNQLKEAKEIICEFYKYISGDVNRSGSFDDEEEVLHAAETIQRLSTLCLELPDDATFIKAKNRVTVAHEVIDGQLENRFKIEMTHGNTESMRRIVNSLSFSKNFSNFISTFVEQSVNKINIHQDLIGNLVATCSESHKLIEMVFPNHNAVMLQLIQSIFTNPLKKNLETRITTPSTDLEQYLLSVYSHYIRLDGVVKNLSSENIIQDNAALNKLFKELFKPYLVNYIQHETNWLKYKLTNHLERFYETIGHQKKAINERSIGELYRDFQAKILHTTGNEEERDLSFNKLLLSQEVAVNILEDVKISLKRCKALSCPTELSEDIQKIMNILVDNLVYSYIHYGIYMGYQTIAMNDNKREPNLLFFQVVHETNNIFQFFDKVVSDTILPLINNSEIQNQCSTKRQQILKDLESRINQGLERLITISIAYINNVLSTEQKKTDFKPEMNAYTFATSPTAEKVVLFLRKIPPQVETCLDGQNRDTFATAFGLQFHRCLMDHLYSFTYSCEGGYTAMQDVNLYDEVIRRFRSSTLDQLFNCLLTLVNVVSMKPENLQSIVKNHLENGIPKELLQNFINLRVDQRAAKALVDFR